MDQQQDRNQDVPNRQSNMEQAEGSRETSERSRGQSGERNSAGGGVSNRSRDREQHEQRQVPERGRSASER